MTMTIPCICPFCGHQTDVTCTYEQYREYTLNPRALVQDVFADKDVHTRETIISGMCKDCQDRFFTDDDEDDCNGVCELCSLGDDCPNSTNY